MRCYNCWVQPKSFCGVMPKKNERWYCGICRIKRCVGCGEIPMQDGWEYCPFCGQQQKTIINKVEKIV